MSSSSATIADMLASGPVIVHVVNSGTDWLSLAAVIGSAVVAIVSLVGAIWQANRISAKADKREHMKLKRQIYAEFLAATDRLPTPLISYRLARDTGDVERMAQFEPKLSELQTAADVALGTVRLIGPDEVVMRAESYNEAARRFALGEDRLDGTGVGLHYKRVANAMRSDLGEPPLPLDQADADSAPEVAK